MRHLVIIAALMAAAPARADEPERPLGFDHLGHDAKLAVAGAEPLPCARCHPIDAAGRLTGALGHRTCFGACHGAPPAPRARNRPYAIAAAQRRLCGNCHGPADVDRAARGAPVVLRPFYPPFGLDSDYGLDFSHAAHAAPARAAQGCPTCHTVPPEPGKPAARRPAAHARCRACHAAPHDPAIPSMTACSTCHKEAFGPATVPHRSPGLFPVDARFSHARHLARINGAAACETCHQNAAQAATEEVPSPTTATCAAAGCHDGATAFSTTTADCRRCHQAPARQTVGLGSARVRYSHAAHDGRGAPADCVACHGGGGDAPAARDHRPCSDAGCHRDEFASAHPVICGACHVGIEPWRPLHRDPLPPPETEFGAVFSHRRHLGGERPPVTAACASCHAAASAERDMRPPRDHLACTAAGCHAAGGVAPAAGDCAGCHRRDLIAQRRADRLAHRWSVRARFRHRPHRDAACTACHTGLLDSDMLADVPAPAKATCVPCHDGGKAFKLTGHGCARCHGH